MEFGQKYRKLHILVKVAAERSRYTYSLFLWIFKSCLTKINYLASKSSAPFSANHTGTLI